MLLDTIFILKRVNKLIHFNIDVCFGATDPSTFEDSSGVFQQDHAPCHFKSGEVFCRKQSDVFGLAREFK